MSHHLPRIIFLVLVCCLPIYSMQGFFYAFSFIAYIIKFSEFIFLWVFSIQSSSSNFFSIPSPIKWDKKYTMKINPWQH